MAGCPSRHVRGSPGREERVLKCQHLAAPVGGPAPGSWGHRVPRRTRGTGGAGDGRRHGPPTAGREERVTDRVRPGSPTRDVVAQTSPPQTRPAERPTWRPPAQPPRTRQPPPESGHRTGASRTAGQAQAPGPTEAPAAFARAGVPPVGRSGAHGNAAGGGGSLVCPPLTEARFRCATCVRRSRCDHCPQVWCDRCWVWEPTALSGWTRRYALLDFCCCFFETRMRS